MQIAAEGHRLLGSTVGTRQFCERYTDDVVTSWKQQFQTLASIALVQPAAANAAFSQGFVGTWAFLSRIAENTGAIFQPLEDTIRSKLISLWTGQAAPGDNVRELLALTSRLRDIGLIHPAVALLNELERSLQTCAALADQIRNQELHLWHVCQLVARNRATASARQKQIIADAALTTRAIFPTPLRLNMDVFFSQRCLALGSQFFQGPAMASPCQKRPSMMPFACATTGSQTIFPLTAIADRHCQGNAGSVPRCRT